MYFVYVFSDELRSFILRHDTVSNVVSLQVIEKERNEEITLTMPRLKKLYYRTYMVLAQVLGVGPSVKRFHLGGDYYVTVDAPFCEDITIAKYFLFNDQMTAIKNNCLKLTIYEWMIFCALSDAIAKQLQLHSVHLCITQEDHLTELGYAKCLECCSSTVTGRDMNSHNDFI